MVDGAIYSCTGSTRPQSPFPPTSQRDLLKQLSLPTIPCNLPHTLPQKHRLRLVATDGAFSMDGDIAPLKEICSLAQKYQALVFIDECHATGFLGPNGRYETRPSC